MCGRKWKTRIERYCYRIWNMIEAWCGEFGEDPPGSELPNAAKQMPRRKHKKAKYSSFRFAMFAICNISASCHRVQSTEVYGYLDIPFFFLFYSTLCDENKDDEFCFSQFCFFVFFITCRLSRCIYFEHSMFESIPLQSRMCLLLMLLTTLNFRETQPPHGTCIKLFTSCYN